MLSCSLDNCYFEGSFPNFVHKEEISFPQQGGLCQATLAGECKVDAKGPKFVAARMSGAPLNDPVARRDED